MKNNGLDIRMLIQFCDNASSQYKSKGPFQFISESSVPYIRCFFGSRYGKGPADGAIGRVKKAAVVARKSGQVMLRNASEFADFVVQHYATLSEKRENIVILFCYV